MVAAVKIFAYADVLSVPIGNANLAQSNEALVLLREPYLGRQALTADTGAAVSSSAVNAPAGTKMLRVQVQVGKRVSYRVTHANGTPTAADGDDPVLEGTRTISFGPGSRISVLEVV